jgi:uncharacterized protein YebE (UPF0316 family)
MSFLQEHPWLLALAIFAVRMIDVSLGTLRTILVLRGHRLVAPLIAFFEVLLWILAVSQVLQDLRAWYLAVAYAGGFATGNFIGMWLEARLALGSELVRVISPNPAIRLGDRLRALRYELTELAGKGSGDEPVEVLLVVEKRRRVPELLRAIEECDSGAWCTLSDVRHPAARPAAAGVQDRGFGALRSKGKRK